MDKLTQLKTALEEILEDDLVTEEEDGSYTVTTAIGGHVRVRKNDRGDWTAYFPSGLAISGAPSYDRPNEVVAWALQ